MNVYRNVTKRDERNPERKSDRTVERTLDKGGHHRYGKEDFERTAEAWIDGAKLRKRREELGLTRDALAERTATDELDAIDPSTIRNFENHKNGARSVPRRTKEGMVYRIAKALGLTAADLMVDMPGADELAAAANLFVTTAEEVTASLPARHPHRTFISVHWESVSTAVDASRRSGRVKSVIDPHNYSSCLARLMDHDRRDIKAFADLTDQTESDMWFAEPNPAETWVSERIFWIDWAQVFDRAKFTKLVRLLKKQSGYRPADHTIKLGLVSGHSTPPHPLGPGAVGRHLLLWGPSLVGGYEHNGPKHEKTHVLVTSPQLFEQANQFYRQLERHTFTFTPGCGETETRRELNALSGVGTFDRDWREHATRPEVYFENYDANIRYWAPWYQETNEQCAECVQREILARFNTREPVRVFEVGCGTGGLTHLIAGWIAAANDLTHGCRYARSYVERLYGLDAASQMLRRMPAELRGNRLCSFNHGVFGKSDVLGLTQGKRVDILCGSLVLHDILDTDPAVSLPRFFTVANDVLVDNGVLVFADIVAADDELVREAELDCWKQRMKFMGLNDDQIEIFLECNPEMRFAVSESQLIAEGQQHGFRVEVTPLREAKTNHIPFKTVVMHRR